MKLSNKLKKLCAVAIVTVVGANSAMADGVAGINAAGTTMRQYIDPVCSMCLMIGAFVGIIGGIRVYVKWNSGDQDINKELMGWGGSCVFLVLSSVVVKAFFGV